MVGDRALWRTAQHYAQLERILFPGIKAIIHGGEEGLEYDFVIQPGAAVTASIAFPDSRVRIESDGSLWVEGPQAGAHHKAPVSYQEFKGQPRAVRSQYAFSPMVRLEST